MKIMELQTPARLYVVTETETPYGGRTCELAPGRTIWGDFRPETPVAQVGETEVCLTQEADFIVRSADGVKRNGRLSLKGFDWRIVSVDELSDRSVRLRIERRQA